MSETVGNIASEQAIDEFLSNRLLSSKITYAEEILDTLGLLYDVSNTDIVELGKERAVDKAMNNWNMKLK